MAEYQDLPEPHIIYRCRSGQAVVFEELRLTEIRFMTNRNVLIAIGLTGNILRQVRDSIDELLETNPDIADWRGERPH